MSTTAWIGVGVAVILLLYVLVMRYFFRESRTLAKRINYKNIRPWQDKDR
jgi:hypothetical protein